MADAAQLEGLDPYDLMAIETTRLDRHFSALDEAAWSQPSRCAGWSVRDLLAHLAASEEYNRASLDGTVAAFLATLGERGVTDLNAANEIGIRDLDDVGTHELLELWRARTNENREVFRSRDGGDIDSSIGAYPARWQAFHLAFELAIHADDVGAPVTSTEQPGRQRWLARFARFAITEVKPEARVVGDDGSTHVTGGDVDVVLPDDVFVRAATGRLDGADSVTPDVREYLTIT
jgi:uncharacterized protein (TIGR03083 family)